MEIEYMQCVTCQKVVSQNETGICLDCQSGFSRSPCSDYFDADDYKLWDVSYNPGDLEDKETPPQCC